MQSSEGRRRGILGAERNDELQPRDVQQRETWLRGEREGIMARVKLSEQREYEFHYPFTVEVRDLNYAAHLGHDAMVTILWEARVHLFRDLGLHEKDLGDGTAFVINDLIVNYKKEGFLFDELDVAIHVGELTGASCRFFYRVSRGGSLVALAEVGLVAFDVEKRRPSRWPGQFLDALKR